MPTPFPGMDPYLEQRALWPDVHNSLITALRDDMAPRLRPRYFVAVEERTYIDGSRGLTFAGRPDVTVLQVREAATRYQTGLWDRQSGVAVVELPVPDTIHELYLEIREQDDRVVTVVEVLSPANKMPGEGRDLYERKRMRSSCALPHSCQSRRVSTVGRVVLLRRAQPYPRVCSTLAARRR